MLLLQHIPLRLVAWFAIGFLCLGHATVAQGDYLKRLFVVDLGSYLEDLEKELGPLTEVDRNTPIKNPVQTERVIADIMSTREETADATVALVWDKTRIVTLSKDDLAKDMIKIRRTALLFSRRYLREPKKTPPANVVGFIESSHTHLGRFLRDAHRDNVKEPRLHIVWIGSRWTQNYVDATGVLSGVTGEQSSAIVYPDACLGMPKAQRKLRNNRLAQDWAVEFELHLVGNQAAPSERSVRSLMHRLGHFDYTQRSAAHGDHVSSSRQRYFGTFQPGCSLEPHLDPAIPSHDMGTDELSGQCKPIKTAVEVDPKYVIRCDEFDAHHASYALYRKARAVTAPGSAEIITVQGEGGTTLSPSTVDLLFTAKDHGRSQLSGGGLRRWLNSLPTATQIDIRIRIENKTICGVGDEFYVEFDVGDPRLAFEGRFHVLVSSLPCNASDAKFVTVQVGVIDVS